MSAKCRSCEAPIVWARHKDTLRLAPIDAGYTDQGNVLLYGGESKSPFYTVGEEVDMYTRPANMPTRTTNHFATCPSAGEHR